MFNIKLGEVVHFDITIHNPANSGQSINADAQPKFWVFEEDTDTGIVAGSGMTNRSGFPGVYRGMFPASSALGFEAQKFYTVIASGRVGASYSLHNPLMFYIENNSFDTLGTGIFGQTVTELTGVPQFPVTYGNMLTWLFEKSKNKGETTQTQDLLFRDNGSTPLASSVLSDNGTTFSWSEYI